MIISHRGVDAKNGVQNTIPALRKTAQAKPNYIEIDIQETKDHKFVVMHDENLKQLADLDTSPQELTLAQLTALTVHENGHQAKIPSFDEYLSVAKQYEQKLLVEIKTTKRDSKNMLKNFFDTYKTTLKQNNHELQSLDYKVITSAKKYAPTLNAYYILPYKVDPSCFSDIIGDYPIYIQESSLFKIFLAIDSPRINFFKTELGLGDKRVI